MIDSIWIGTIVLVFIAYVMIWGIMYLGETDVHKKSIYLIASIIAMIYGAYELVSNETNGVGISAESVIILIVGIIGAYIAASELMDNKCSRKEKTNLAQVMRQKKKYWIIGICLLGVLVIPIILVEVSLVLDEKVDMNVDWLVFLSDYIGTILAGILSAIVALVICNITINNDKKREEKKEVLTTLDKILEVNAVMFERIEATAYNGIHCVETQENTSDDIVKMKRFLESKRLARTSALEIYVKLEVSKDHGYYKTDNVEDLYNKIKTIYELLEEYSGEVIKAKEYNETLVEQHKKLFDLANDFMEELQKYVKCVHKKIVTENSGANRLNLSE